MKSLLRAAVSRSQPNRMKIVVPSLCEALAALPKLKIPGDLWKISGGDFSDFLIVSDHLARKVTQAVKMLLHSVISTVTLISYVILCMACSPWQYFAEPLYI
jgi:hypothetical protein